MVNTLLFELLQTLNCQALNNLRLCLSGSISSCRANWLNFQPFWSNNRMTTRLCWFPTKEKLGTRAITNICNLYICNCPLFVWQNQDTFMQSVIGRNYCVAVTHQDFCVQHVLHKSLLLAIQQLLKNCRKIENSEHSGNFSIGKFCRLTV